MLLRHDPTSALLSTRGDGEFLVVLAHLGDGHPTPPRLDALLANLPLPLVAESRDRPLHVVWVGADAAAIAATTDVLPTWDGWTLAHHTVLCLAHGRYQLAQAEGDGAWGLLVASVERANALELPPTPEQLRRAEKAADAAARAYVAFSDDAGDKVPWIVWAIVAPICVVLVLEAYWGGTELTATLTRMGGNLPERVFAGEGWRLWTAGWLHAGVPHALANIYGLLMVAPLLARALGPARFLVLYLGSMLGAEAFAALGDPDAVCVGASGGVFGLIGALVAATWSNLGMMPAQTARGARWFFLVFALIQVVASFGPHVDLRAHAGGLASGALLVLTRAVTLGQPRPWRDDRGWRAAQWAMRVLALALVAATGQAAHQALHLGEPAALIAGHDRRVLLGDTGLQLLVPAGAERRVETGPDGDYTAITYGSMTFDALVLTVWVRPLADDERAQTVAAWVQARQLHLLTAKPLVPPRTVPKRVEIAGQPWIHLDQKSGDVLQPRWIGVSGGYEVDLQVTLATDARDACFGDVQRFVASVEP